MPIHDWTRVEPGDFHHFHPGWITDFADALNMGGLPPGCVRPQEPAHRAVSAGKRRDARRYQAKRDGPSMAIMASSGTSGGAASREGNVTRR